MGHLYICTNLHILINENVQINMCITTFLLGRLCLFKQECTEKQMSWGAKVTCLPSDLYPTENLHPPKKMIAGWKVRGLPKLVSGTRKAMNKSRSFSNISVRCVLFQGFLWICYYVLSVLHYTIILSIFNYESVGCNSFNSLWMVMNGYRYWLLCSCKVQICLNICVFWKKVLKYTKSLPEPWLNDNACSLRHACRQAERKWKKKKLQFSFEILWHTIKYQGGKEREKPSFYPTS